MEPLPEVDEHVRPVAASPDRAWQALVAVLAGSVREIPRPLAAAWGLEPRARNGDPSTRGSTIPGFVVAEADPPRRLTLRGRHRFSRYEIRFILEPAAAGPVERTRRRVRSTQRTRRSLHPAAGAPPAPRTPRVNLSVRTAATFPGLPGRAYRALVIGSGGHALVMRRLLSRVARHAES